MPLRNFRTRLAKLLDQTRDAAQRDIPAAQLRDQIGPANLGPRGNTGAGYTPVAHASSHEDGGADPLDLGSIAGELTDAQHGDRAGGTLHDVVTGSVAGFQSAADKAKEDLYPDVSGLTPGDVLTALTSSTVGFAPPTGGGLPAGAPGDIIYYDATSTPTLLPIGDVGDMLYVGLPGGDTLPIWDVPPAPTGVASGDLTGSYPSPQVAGIWGIPISNLAPNDGDVYRYDSGGNIWLPDAAGSGTVTSVALTAPAELSVSGGPITGAGTLALSWANATANRVLAGPTTGSPGTPSFRALVAADIPNLPESQITGLVSDLSALAAGIADTYTKSASDARYAPISVVGSVTSVGLALPSLFSVSGSPVTGSGTLTGAFATQSANTVLAGPTSGGAATPTMRALVAGDIPNPLNATGIRTAIGANAAGLYVQWITGDTLPTSRFGASTTGNNQVAVYANSDSATAINAISNSGAGFYGQSSTGVPLQGARTSSLTNVIANVLSFAHNTSGTAAAGFGAGIRFRLQSSTTADQDAAQSAAVWTDATHATRTSALTFSTVNSAAALAERMRLTGVGALWVGRTSGGLTGAGDLDVAGNVAVGGSISAGAWAGTAIDAAHGGTGQASYAVGDLLYASGTTALSKLADVATGNVLLSGGVTTAPTWGKVDLTAHVSGVLPSANGGTGVNNAGTITNATNTTITGGGTVALGGFTLTVPATGSAALLGTANAFTAAQTATVSGNSQSIFGALSGASGTLAGISVGRTAAEIVFGVAAAANQFFTGMAAGDGVLRNTAGTQLAVGVGSTAQVRMESAKIGFLGTAAISRPNITGVSSGTPTAAQQAAVIRAILTAGANLGLWTDSTT